MEKFNIGSETLWYSVEQAKVVQIESSSETVITGGGGGGTIYNGTGSTSGVYVSSSTINRKTVYLEDNNGKQYAINLTDWNLSALQGHELVLIKVQSTYNSNYAVIYNKTLDTVYRNRLDSFFKKMAELSSGYYIIAALVVIGVSSWAYSVTKSNTVGGISFVGMCIFVGLKFKQHIDQQKKSQHYALRLKTKLDEILEPY